MRECTMRIQSDRAGFALPMAILVIGFMTAGVVAAFARASSEVRLVDNQRAQTTAFAVAQAGLDRYLARGRVAPADTTSTGVTYIVGNDTAKVRVWLMRAAPGVNDTALYLIRSEGITRGGVNIPAGRRTIAQFAFRPNGNMNVRAAWTSLSGLDKNGNSGTLSGINGCMPTDSVAGVSVPTGTYTGTPNPNHPVVHGKPPIEEMGTQSAMADTINKSFDWSGIADPNVPGWPKITGDHVVCYPSTYGYDARWLPCSAWPTNLASDSTYWPVIVINGSTSLPSNGQGLLIVTGDLTVPGNARWFGIILVGGRITDNGSGDVGGAVLTGLNVLKGDVVGQSSQLNGTKDYEYDSCKIQRAATGAMKLSQISNAWVDNWSAW